MVKLDVLDPTWESLKEDVVVPEEEIYCTKLWTPRFSNVLASCRIFVRLLWLKTSI